MWVLTGAGSWRNLVICRLGYPVELGNWRNLAISGLGHPVDLGEWRCE